VEYTDGDRPLIDTMRSFRRRRGVMGWGVWEGTVVRAFPRAEIVWRKMSRR
jgi:hypothetical protein